jgi:hypothetical protein
MSFDVFIMEVEWLFGNFNDFFVSLGQSEDKEIYKNGLILFLL